MKLSHRSRRLISVLAILAVVAGWLIVSPKSYEQEIVPATAKDQTNIENNQSLDSLGASSDAAQADTQTNAQAGAQSGTQEPTALSILQKLEIKGRAPKTGYARTEFYNNWPTINGCSLRQIIIKRELGDNAILDPSNNCDVISGTFTEPYTGSELTFYQKSDFSKKIQIDHIVALSDAWQKGAQYKTKDERYQMATDPLNLIAADAGANQQKSDGDAATWLPSNKAFRCQYVARQISVKYKYGLWLTQAEHDAMENILKTCPNEPAIGV